MIRQSTNVPAAIRQIYNSVLEPAGMTEALAAMAHATRAHRAAFNVQTIGADARFMTIGYGFEPDMMERFKRMHVEVPAPKAYLSLPSGQVRRRSDLISNRAFRRSALYCEIIGPNQGFEGMLARMELSDLRNVSVAVDRYCRAPDFEGRDVRAFAALLPHWISAWRLRQKLDTASATTQCACSALDCLATGVIFVDAHLKPLYLNARAGRIAASGDGLLISKQLVSAVARDEAHALQRAVSAAIQMAAGSVDRDSQAMATRAPLRITRTSSHSAYVVRIAPIVPERAEWLHCSGAVVGLFIDTLDEQPTVDVAMLAARHGLAPREAELTAQLAKGATVSQAAAALGIGVGTARWYLKRILEKTGTHRQAELVSLAIRCFSDRTA